ncbi:MAG: hypothetical protein ACRDRS_10680 [Pseudonocardiaceae bacterium]
MSTHRGIAESAETSQRTPTGDLLRDLAGGQPVVVGLDPERPSADASMLDVDGWDLDPETGHHRAAR